MSAFDTKLEVLEAQARAGIVSPEDVRSLLEAIKILRGERDLLLKSSERVMSEYRHLREEGDIQGPIEVVERLCCVVEAIRK